MKTILLLLLLVPNLVYAETAVIGTQWKQIDSTVYPADDITGINISGLNNYTGFPAGASTLQDAYEGGDTITTNATNDEVIIKYGGDNGTIQEWQKNDGTPVFTVTTSFHPGKYIQHTYTSFGALVSTTALIPVDGTIPQNTEGLEIISLAITPSSNNSIISVSSHVHLAHSVAGTIMACALFRDSDSDSLDTGYVFGDQASNSSLPTDLYYEESNSNKTERTYKVRCGGSQAGTLYINGNAGGTQWFGGSESSYILIEEKLP